MLYLVSLPSSSTPMLSAMKAVTSAQMAGAGFGTYLLVALIIWGSMAPILKAAKNEAFGALLSRACMRRVDERL